MIRQKILARSLFYDGSDHFMILISPSGNGEFTLEPFRVETHSTIFEDGRLALIPADMPLPEGNEPDTIISQLRDPAYKICDKPLKLISITRKGCFHYPL